MSPKNTPQDGQEDGERKELPAADIPDLKKREKERKKAGAAWWGPQGARTPFSGAMGGQGAASAGAAARAAAAAALQASAPAAGNFLARLGAGLMSKLLIGLGVASVASGVALYSYVRLHERPRGMGLDLGSVSSSVKVRSGADNERLEYAAWAGRGEIKWDAAAATKIETVKRENTVTEAAPQAEMAPGVETVGTANRDGMAHNLSGSRLTEGLGGGFGGKNIFASIIGAAPRFGSGYDRSRLISFKGPPAAAGRLTKPPRNSVRVGRADPRSLAGVRSGRAMAQLKWARGTSFNAALGKGEQGMKAGAADAFEQNAGVGGEITAADSPVGGAYGPVTPAGGLKPFELPPEPETPPGQNATNWQPPLDAALSLGALAGMLKMISMLLIIAGIALIIAGSQAGPAGIGLIIAGIALIAIGVMMYMMAMQMAAMAKQMGDMIKNMYGQEYQGEIVDQCMDQAVGNGTQPKDCNPATKPKPAKTTVEADVKKEREAKFEVDGGKPVQ